MEDGSDWQPPSEAEMKLIQARRERSDKISKLMSSYLLKGYKMLGVVCATCDTILLQDRQGTKYCVACSELDTDTDKDDPVTNHSAALTMAREIELASSGTTSSTSDSRGAGAGGTTATKVTTVPVTPRTLQNRSGHDSGRIELNGDGAQMLSMSSIDVQSWPSDPGTCLRDQGAAMATAAEPSELSIKLEAINGSGDSDSGLHSLTGESFLSPSSHRGKHQVNAQQQTSRSSFSTPSSSSLSTACIASLCEKIAWASKELKDTPSVEYSIQLCTLIKGAAEAVTAVRTARI